MQSLKHSIISSCQPFNHPIMQSFQSHHHAIIQSGVGGWDRKSIDLNQIFLNRFRAVLCSLLLGTPGRHLREQIFNFSGFGGEKLFYYPAGNKSPLRERRTKRKSSGKKAHRVRAVTRATARKRNKRKSLRKENASSAVKKGMPQATAPRRKKIRTSDPGPAR